jgi:ATP-binding cassette subfamily B protein
MMMFGPRGYARYRAKVKPLHWVRDFPSFVNAAKQMTRLAWQADPRVFSGMVVNRVLQGLLPVAKAWIFKQIFDLLALNFQQGTVSALPGELIPLLVMQAILNLVASMMGAFNLYANNELSRKLTLKTQTIVYEKISSLDGLAYFEDPHFHDTLSLASRGVQMGPMRMLHIVTNALSGMVTLVSFLGVLLYLSPVLALVVAFESLPQLFMQLKMGSQRFGLAFMNSPKERRAFYLGNVLSNVHYVKELRLFNLANFFLNQFLETTREVQASQRQQQVKELRWRVGLGVLSSVVSGVALIVVVLQAFSGRIGLGDVTLYLSAFGGVQGALSDLINSFTDLNENVLFFSHYTNLLALPPLIPIANPTRPVPPLQRGIELRNVSFRYSEQHPYVLKDINLLLPKGKCLALVGLNGAGKTTLVKLLARLYDPDEGQILWDGIDIREFDPKELRQHMGAIFQDFVRYDLTAQENIGLGNIDEIHNLPRIQKAAQEVGVHQMIEEMPQGYKTILSRWLVEEGTGVDLSGGQWQKIAIARMFMRQADFLILDEPTASLDAQAEYEIYSHFLNLIRGRTSMLISHRFSTVRIADLIAVLEDGKIVECGTHEELVASGSTYAKLYTLQASQYT